MIKNIIFDRIKMNIADGLIIMKYIYMDIYRIWNNPIIIDTSLDLQGDHQSGNCGEKKHVFWGLVGSIFNKINTKNEVKIPK
jgi:hypothetical protein